MTRLTIKDSLEKLSHHHGTFIKLFSHGTLEVEIYKPEKVDLQKPHTRDEVYVISTGTGEFVCGNEKEFVATGDVLFVPAGMDHRFLNFTDNFSAWVFFYGPEGGEKNVEQL
ncbi:MAG TPA: cupin domain-containing protein [Candidatus Angelobacter sp.]|nr:cupin domain-containing protein [Candidatus Angelobacter sp.]